MTAPRLDASELVRGLWQGAVPWNLDELKARFDVVVFCAAEFQPDAEELAMLRPLDVVLAPNDDSGRPPTDEELRIAVLASRAVAEKVRAGKRVLVTCHQGRNRSGLVAALSIYRLTGWPGSRCVSHVRSRRPNALTNRYFTRAVEVLRGAGAAA